MQTPNKEIPPERKAMYYGGMALVVLGLLLFLSTFVVGFSDVSEPNLNNFGEFEEFVQEKSAQARSTSRRAFGGMILMMIGGVLMTIGARGWAGAGVLLDPEQARKDVEPWSRMGGGIIQDAVSEIDVVKKVEDRLDAPEPVAPAPVVKVRCQSCQSLNDETAKFCDQCGSKI